MKNLSIAKTEFANLTVGNNEDPEIFQKNFDILTDLELKVEIDIGNTIVTIKELLTLSVGSIVELDSPLGTHSTLVTNGIKLAKGEVVVMNDKFALRLTEILSEQE